MPGKMFDPQIVADRLRTLMNEHSIGPAKFGNRIGGVSRQTVHNWLAMRSMPTASCLFQIGCEFHVDVNWILGLTDERR